MSINSDQELDGMRAVSQAVGITLKEMREHVRPGMSARALDEYGGKILSKMGAKSAPKLTYGFPGWTCVSVNNEVAHGIPKEDKIFKEGDLVNIDVSAELNGYWSDNGGSFVLGEDIHNYTPLIETSRNILSEALSKIKAGVRIAHIGKFIQTQAKGKGYRVIKNLAGHGVGRSLHEEPKEILNCYDRSNRQRFIANTTIAVETFISTKSNYAVALEDSWTLVGNKGGFVAQHEHTILVTNDKPLILTASNEIFN